MISFLLFSNFFTKNITSLKRYTERQNLWVKLKHFSKSFQLISGVFVAADFESSFKNIFHRRLSLLLLLNSTEFCIRKAATSSHQELHSSCWRYACNEPVQRNTLINRPTPS